MLRFINWILDKLFYDDVTKGASSESIGLLWMDLREQLYLCEGYYLEGSDPYGGYCSDHVVFSHHIENGSYTQEVWRSTIADVEYFCDTEYVKIYRSEEVLREV